MITKESFRSCNEITIKIDNDCEMAVVYLNDNHVMTGNFWDFHPGCHGPLIDNSRFQNWRGYWALAQSIAHYATTLGFKAEVKKIAYCYGES